MIFTAELSHTVDELRQTIIELADWQEKKLAEELKALPIAVGWWSYSFLSPTGEVITVDAETNERQKSSTPQDLLRAIVWGSQRYPKLASFIPERPESAISCQFCQGSGRLETNVGKRAQGGSCPHCAGLGWLVSDA